MHAVGSTGEAAARTTADVEALVAKVAREVTPSELVGCGAAGAAAVEVEASSRTSDGPNISDSPVDVVKLPRLALACATVGTAEAAACISERI